MLKNISKLGKALNKAEQRTIHGGIQCYTHDDCSSNSCCVGHVCVSYPNAPGTPNNPYTTYPGGLEPLCGV